MLDYFDNFTDYELLFINIVVCCALLDACLIWFFDIIREIIYERKRKL